MGERCGRPRLRSLEDALAPTGLSWAKIRLTVTDYVAPAQQRGMRSVRHPLAPSPGPVRWDAKVAASIILGLVAACGGDPGGPASGHDASGGAGASTGATGATSISGGAAAGGSDRTDVAATGGIPGIGGNTAGGTGGADITTTGGIPSTGGAGTTGGATAGGTAAAGTTLTGGRSATGGTMTTGGAAPTGGTTSTGGTAPTGGTTATGGAGTGGTTTSTHEVVLQESETGFCSVDGVIEADNAGFSGTGYANTNNALGAAIEWGVEVGTPGTYGLTFTYANPDADRPAALLVDGSNVVPTLSFPGTSDWTAWTTVTTDVTLAAGEVRIRLQATTDSGLSNIDSLTLAGDSLSPIDCVPEAPTGPITVWIAGDSTVANGSTPCPTGWGVFFADYFNEQVTVVNSAVGGRSVRTWLYDVTDQMGGDGECIINTNVTGARVVQDRWTTMLSQMREGDYLFIQFGINDGDRSCPRHVGLQAFQEEYAMMAQAARERGANPVFLTPVSMIRCSGNTPTGSRGFLDETFAVGAQEGVPVIDLHQLSVELYTELGFCPIPGGDVSATTTGPVGDFFCDDHTHFSDSGAEQIAQVVANAVADVGLPLAAYLQ